MRFFRINKDNWINGVSDGLNLPCAICNRKKIQFDYNVTDEFWNDVVPEEYRRGVICLECLDKLAMGKKGDLGSNIVSLQFAGIDLTIEFIPCNVFYRNYQD